VTGTTRRGGSGEFRFDYVDDFINVPSFVLPANSPVTITFWTRVVSGNLSIAFTLGNLNSPNRCMMLGPWVDGNIMWDYGDDGNGRITTSFTPYFGQYTYVSLVSSPTFKGIYLNAVLVNSGTVTAAAPVLLSSVLLGAWTFGSYYYNGTLDDFRIWNRVLSAPEISTLYRESLLGYPTLLNWEVAPGFAQASSPRVRHRSTLY
jgi:hypothetical protein